MAIFLFGSDQFILNFLAPSVSMEQLNSSWPLSFDFDTIFGSFSGSGFDT